MGKPFHDEIRLLFLGGVLPELELSMHRYPDLCSPAPFTVGAAAPAFALTAAGIARVARVVASDLPQTCGRAALPGSSSKVKPVALDAYGPFARQPGADGGGWRRDSRVTQVNIVDLRASCCGRDAALLGGRADRFALPGSSSARADTRTQADVASYLLCSRSLP
jgi:hypothetical protein